MRRQSKNSGYLPLGLVACFVFFPYKSRTDLFVDASVTEIIDLHKSDLLVFLLCSYKAVV
jgi:hypothetical protein